MLKMSAWKTEKRQRQTHRGLEIEAGSGRQMREKIKDKVRDREKR